MTRKESLECAVKVLSNVNNRSIARNCGKVYDYSVDEERLLIVVNSRILFKPDFDNIYYLYVELVDNELIVQF